MNILKKEQLIKKQVIYYLFFNDILYWRIAK